MSLLIDVFGYLSIVLHGLTVTAQSAMLGGVLFLVLLARPLAGSLGPAGGKLLAGTSRIAAYAAVALIVCEGLTIAIQVAVLMNTVDLGLFDTLGAEFALAGLVKITVAAAIAIALFAGGAREGKGGTPSSMLLALVAVELASATLTTHAAARIDGRGVLLVVSGLHQLGAAIWIGGIPCFLLALAYVQHGRGWRLVGARFSRMSMAGVGCILLSGATMGVVYVGSVDGFYGTAYGVMVAAKIGMFSMLLLLGLGNYLLVERLRADPATPVLRLRRFAEVEIGIGIAIFFAAASLTSVPPAIDLTHDRVTWAEIVERNTPAMPRLVSPQHDDLALPALQNRLDAEAAAQRAAPQAAFTPGSGELPPRNAADIAWSEYNHHWAGLFVVVIGLLALANQAGLRAARHWPLVFLGLAVFLFLRSDPEVWPLGEQGFFASFRDVEVLQHRVFVVLITAFAFFEWRVRTGSAKPGGWTSRHGALVFPIVTFLGGVLLLTHSHAIANVRDQLLVEITHTPIALASIAAGCARWLELRLNPPASRIAGWVWPACFIFIGAMLMLYREA